MKDEKQLIQSYYDRVEPSAEFRQKLLELERQNRKKAPARWKPLAVAAAIALVSMAGLGYLKAQRPQFRPTPTDPPAVTESAEVSETPPATQAPTAEPVPTETPVVTAPPSEPAITEPTAPAPTESKPTEPKPAAPKPTAPQATEPEPTGPAPTQTEPTDPEPTEPEPSETQPTEPTEEIPPESTEPEESTEPPESTEPTEENPAPAEEALPFQAAYYFIDGRDMVIITNQEDGTETFLNFTGLLDDGYYLGTQQIQGQMLWIEIFMDTRGGYEVELSPLRTADPPDRGFHPFPVPKPPRKDERP